MIQTEVHVYAFSIAANILLSLFPLLIILLSICQRVLHWRAASDAVFLGLSEYFPDDLGHFIAYNLAVIVRDNRFQIFSMVLLFFTANGIFEPLEVAFNRAWGCRVNRSYFRNQLVSLGLIFACGALGLLSTLATAMNTQMVAQHFHPQGSVSTLFARVLFNLAAVPLSMLMLFLIYWLLPNCKVQAVQIIPAAIVVGLLLEGLKYLNLWTWPFLRDKWHNEYGPFYYSASTILWSFLGAMLVLAGAEWSARHAGVSPTPIDPQDLSRTERFSH